MFENDLFQKNTRKISFYQLGVLSIFKPSTVESIAKFSSQSDTDGPWNGISNLPLHLGAYDVAQLRP